jgi:hypothetical protein
MAPPASGRLAFIPTPPRRCAAWADPRRPGAPTPRGSSRRGRTCASTRRHLRLDEAFWDQTGRVATHRYFVVDAGTGAVERHAESVQAYSVDEYRALLRDAGFALHRVEPSLDGTREPGDFVFLVAEAL